MKRKLLFMLLIILVIPVVYSSNESNEVVAIPIVFCEHMGYSIQIDEENKPVCVFTEDFSCNAYEFYKGNCGKEYIKEFRDREKGEIVYTEFENCKEGYLPSKPTYLLEPSRCYKPSKLRTFFGALRNFFDIDFF